LKNVSDELQEVATSVAYVTKRLRH
jgi:hypothetical protein